MKLYAGQGIKRFNMLILKSYFLFGEEKIYNWRKILKDPVTLAEEIKEGGTSSILAANFSGFRIAWETHLWVWLTGRFQIGLNDEGLLHPSAAETAPWIQVCGWIQRREEWRDVSSHVFVLSSVSKCHVLLPSVPFRHNNWQLPNITHSN